MSEKKRVSEYIEINPEIFNFDENKNKREKIHLYHKEHRREILKVLSYYWRFAALTAALAAIFFAFYVIFFEEDHNVDFEDSLNTFEQEFNEKYSDTQPNLEVSATVKHSPPVLINEAGCDINIDNYFDSQKTSEFIFKNDGEIKVLITHAHSCEKVSENMSVIDAGEVILQFLTTAEIGAVHCKVPHDNNGRIGAYNSMKDTVLKLKKEHPGVVLVIDLHGSDSSSQILFDIGSETKYAWKENLLVATKLCYNMDRNDTAIRILPDNLGQDNGIITINVSLGQEEADDSFARELIADLSLGIISLFAESTPD